MLDEIHALYFRLNSESYWEDALQQAAHIQVRTALPGRCTPFELTYGRQPDVTILRIFGKDKEVKTTT